jgi:DNA repair exonuclease SbcCD ATPase subunit
LSENNFSNLQNKLKAVKKSLQSHPSKIGWIYSNIFKKRQKNNIQLFSKDGRRTEIPTKFEEFKLAEDIYVQQISVYSDTGDAKLKIEILPSDSLNWEKVHIYTDNEGVYQYFLPKKAIKSIRIRSDKRYNNRPRKETITKINIYGSPLRVLYQSARMINDKIDILDEAINTTSEIETHFSSLEPEIEALETTKTNLEKSIATLRLSETEQKKAKDDLMAEKSQKNKLEAQNQQLQKDIVSKERRLSDLENDISQYAPDLRRHRELLKSQSRTFIIFGGLMALTLAILLYYIYGQLNDILDIYLEHNSGEDHLDYKALIALKIFYGIFVFIILFAIEEAVRKSLKAALNMLEEDRTISAAMMMIGKLVRSSSDMVNLDKDEIRKLQASAKAEAFNGTRYEYLKKLEASNSSYLPEIIKKLLPTK